MYIGHNRIRGIGNIYPKIFTITGCHRSDIELLRLLMYIFLNDLILVFSLQGSQEIIQLLHYLFGTSVCLFSLGQLIHFSVNKI